MMAWGYNLSVLLLVFERGGVSSFDIRNDLRNTKNNKSRPKIAVQKYTPSELPTDNGRVPYNTLRRNSFLDQCREPIVSTTNEKMESRNDDNNQLTYSDFGTVQNTVNINSMARRTMLSTTTFSMLFASLSRPAGAVDNIFSITDKIYVDIKGLPSVADAATSSGVTPTKRIVIGLYGNYAPQCVKQLKQLVTSTGLPASCRPLVERALQKEQLEANKVYNNCIEGQSIGITLKYSTIWRIIKDERIDMGAVTGRFVSREYPTWDDTINSGTALSPTGKFGTVSVRRGNTSGFGFTIYPGSDGVTSSVPSSLPDDEQIVIGQVLDGLDIIQQLNDIPVIQSSKLNYMSITGGPKTSTAPDRSCRYGGPMYCNENKPLVKLTITDTGIL